MKIALGTLLLGILLVLAAVGLTVSLVSYLRVRTRKMAFISIVFTLFLAKSILMVISLFWPLLAFLNQNQFPVVFDIAVIVCLLIAGLWE